MDEPDVRAARWSSGPSTAIAAASRWLTFGLVLDKGSPLTTCVNEAIAEIRRQGLINEYITEYIDDTSRVFAEGWNWPVFTREYLLTRMICHHFRFFRKRDWARTAGFNEGIRNAVDYDMMLKLAEVGEVVECGGGGLVVAGEGRPEDLEGAGLQGLGLGVVAPLVVERRVAAGHRLQLVEEVRDDLGQRQPVAQLHPVLGEVVHALELTALGLAQLHDRADELRRRQDRHLHDRLVDPRHLAGGPVRRVGDDDFAAVFLHNAIHDVGRRRYQIESPPRAA